jgi:hypothetical protein
MRGAWQSRGPRCLCRAPGQGSPTPSVAQSHIWMVSTGPDFGVAANAGPKRLLQLLPVRRSWRSATSDPHQPLCAAGQAEYPRLNFSLCTAIYIYISLRVFHNTVRAYPWRPCGLGVTFRTAHRQSNRFSGGFIWGKPLTGRVFGGARRAERPQGDRGAARLDTGGPPTSGLLSYLALPPNSDSRLYPANSADGTGLPGPQAQRAAWRGARSGVRHAGRDPACRVLITYMYYVIRFMMPITTTVAGLWACLPLLHG